MWAFTFPKLNYLVTKFSRILNRNIFLQDDDVTIRDDLKEESPNEFAFPQLRRASWGNIEPAVQDHQQQLDTQEPVVSWMPQIGLRREVNSILDVKHYNVERFTNRTEINCSCDSMLDTQKGCMLNIY